MIGPHPYLHTSKENKTNINVYLHMDWVVGLQLCSGVFEKGREHLHVRQ